MNLPAIEYAPAPKARAVLTLEDESIRALLLQIARSLVPGEDSVAVNISIEGELSTATVVIAPEHLGRLVGQQGRIARAIRTILTAAAMTFGRRYMLDIKATS